MAACTDNIIPEAAISNPNVSEEAKERAADRLESMQDEGQLDSREAHEANVAIGHKVCAWDRRRAPGY